MPHVDQHDPGTPTWVDLMTSDPEAARRFYGPLLGWTFEVGGPEYGGYAMCLRDGRMVAGMGPQQAGDPATAALAAGGMPTVWTLYFATADVDATCAAIKAAGGGVMVAPMEVMGQGKMAIATEPTGAVFGLWQAIAHNGAGLIGEPGSMAWNELNTRDQARASAFMTQVFGLQAHVLDAPGIEYQTLHLGEETVGGIMQMGPRFPAEVPPHWMIYFAVADTDAACAQVDELGGKVLVPPFDTSYGRIAVVQDPQGGTFSIVKPTAAG